MARPATPKSSGRPSRVAGSRRCSTIRFTARWLLPFAVLSSGTGCRNLFTDPDPVASRPVLAAGALLPSPRLIVGRIIAVDEAQRLAFVELATDAPSAALIAGTELAARTLNLRDTGRLQVSAYVRGRTLGTQIVGGQPSPGDEVVWLAP